MSPLAVGAIFGDRRTYRGRDGAALRLVEVELERVPVPDDIEIQLIYTFTGTLSWPDWTGLKVSGQTRSAITIEIGVPADWRDEAELVHMGREAIGEAVARLTRPGTGLDQRRSSLPVTEEHDTVQQVIVSLPADRLTLEELHALENVAARHIRQAKLGVVTGHEIGEGSFELFIEGGLESEAQIRDTIDRLFDAALRSSSGDPRAT